LSMSFFPDIKPLIDEVKELNKKRKKDSKLESIDTAQLEYTAERIFTYSTIAIAVAAVYAAIIFMGVQQLRK
ncbi:9595_t:CDS:2, partial [Cetraspora pellucida]